MDEYKTQIDSARAHLERIKTTAQDAAALFETIQRAEKTAQRDANEARGAMTRLAAEQNALRDRARLAVEARDAKVALVAETDRRARALQKRVDSLEFDKAAVSGLLEGEQNRHRGIDAEVARLRAKVEAQAAHIKALEKLQVQMKAEKVG